MRAFEGAPAPMVDHAAADARATANAHMQRGLALMRQPDDMNSVTTALAHFEAALAIRQTLPHEDTSSCFALAASWMNRAEALLARGRAADLAVAIGSLDEAVRLLETLPLDTDARFRRRLSIALQNRALIRRRVRSETWRMVPDLFRAIDLLAPPGDEDDARLIATAWMNIGAAQVYEPTEDAWRRAMTSARQALCTIGAREQSEEQMAEIGLHARLVICRAVARCLEAHRRTDVNADVHAATDAVEDSLALVSVWERKGVPRFRARAAELFEFGRRVYSIYQPQFVVEFEREHAAASGLLLGVR